MTTQLDTLMEKLRGAARNAIDKGRAVLLGGDWNEGASTGGTWSPSWLASEADLNKSSVRGYKVKNFMNERGFAIIDALEEVAGELNATPTQVALAWLMVRPSITAPIASASKLEQLPDLIASVDLKLSDEAIQRLNTASAY